jgi:hypothetical protein
MEPRDRVVQQLVKIRERLAGKSAKWPPGFNNCDKCGKDISFELAGMFLNDNIDLIIESIRRLD